MQILLEWLEKFVSEPVVFSEENLVFLEGCVEKQEFKHTAADRDLMPKVNFKVVQKIVGSVLYPLYGKRDFGLVVSRVTICLLGRRKQWDEVFEGRKMRKIQFSEENKEEFRLFKVLNVWCEMNMKMVN